MSITDELRECIATAVWQYENDIKTAYIPKDRLTAIADRIDAEHRRGMATAQQVGYNEGEDAAMRDGWAKLPVDADGVPIRVGDVMEWPTTGETFEVVGISANTLFYIEHGFDDSAQWTAAHNKRHHHAPTVEDVLREFFSRYVTTKPKDEDDAILAEYAKRLTLAGEGA